MPIRLVLIIGTIGILYALHRRRSSAEGQSPPWPTWTPIRIAIALSFGAVAMTLSVIRLQYPHVPDEPCSHFADSVNEGFEYGLMYFDAVYLLTLPLLAIAALRRESKWETAALLLMFTGIPACFNGAIGFNCD